ncbi:MAG: hypothetical protein WA182_11235 [Candidatus Sulfotelmatobacter sp.]
MREIEEWIPPMSLSAIQLAEHLARHRETFGSPDTLVGTSSELGETPKIMMEPRQSQHMVCKLLEQQKATLQNLRKIADANTHGRADATHNSDFNPRFLADANRELRRAVDRYLYLKKKGL